MSAPNVAEVAAALRVVASWLESQAQNETTPAAAEWISQRKSPAGSRRHLNEVRRLVAAGSDQARIVGRLYYLRPAALDVLLGKVTARHAPAPNAPEVDELAALRARLEKGKAA